MEQQKKTYRTLHNTVVWNSAFAGTLSPGILADRRTDQKKPELHRRSPTPYSDGACSFMTSMASAECAMAAPALISAATQMASMISFSLAPF